MSACAVTSTFASLLEFAPPSTAESGEHEQETASSGVQKGTEAPAPSLAVPFASCLVLVPDAVEPQPRTRPVIEGLETPGAPSSAPESSSAAAVGESDAMEVAEVVWQGSSVAKLGVMLWPGQGTIQTLPQDHTCTSEWQQAKWALSWVRARLERIRGVLPGLAVHRTWDMAVDVIELQGHMGAAWDMGAAVALALLQACTHRYMKGVDTTVVMAGLDGDQGLLLGLEEQEVPNAAALIATLKNKGVTRFVVPAGQASSFSAAAKGSGVRVVGVRLMDEAIELLMPGVLDRPLVTGFDSVKVYRMPSEHVRKTHNTMRNEAAVDIKCSIVFCGF